MCWWELTKTTFNVTSTINVYICVCVCSSLILWLQNYFWENNFVCKFIGFGLILCVYKCMAFSVPFECKCVCVQIVNDNWKCHRSTSWVHWSHGQHGQRPNPQPQSNNQTAKRPANNNININLYKYNNDNKTNIQFRLRTKYVWKSTEVSNK